MGGRNLKKMTGMTRNLEFRITESIKTTLVIVMMKMMMTKSG
jgi:hypothetical protein